MNENTGDVSGYRLSRASECLEEAQILAQADHWNACVNRLYYACFYAVSAALAQRNYSSSKHSGVRSLFNQHFVKAGLVIREVAYVYNDLFERRRESDYEDFFVFEEAEVLPWIGGASEFVQTLAKLIASYTQVNMNGMS